MRRNAGPHLFRCAAPAAGRARSVRRVDPHREAEARREGRLVRAGLRRGPPHPLTQSCAPATAAAADGQRLPGGVHHDEVGPGHRDLQVDAVLHPGRGEGQRQRVPLVSNTTPRYVAPRADTAAIVRTYRTSRPGAHGGPRPAPPGAPGRRRPASPHDRLAPASPAAHRQARRVHRHGQAVAEGDDAACLHRTWSSRARRPRPASAGRTPGRRRRRGRGPRRRRDRRQEPDAPAPPAADHGAHPMHAGPAHRRGRRPTARHTLRTWHRSGRSAPSPGARPTPTGCAGWTAGWPGRRAGACAARAARSWSTSGTAPRRSPPSSSRAPRRVRADTGSSGSRSTPHGCAWRGRWSGRA